MNFLAPNPTLLIGFYFPIFAVLIALITRFMCLNKYFVIYFISFFIIGTLSVALTTFLLVAYTNCTHVTSNPVSISEAFTIKAIRNCIFDTPTPWGVTIDNRFQGLSYYFSVTETPEYMNTINFMRFHINKSFEKYQTGITIHQIRNAQNSGLVRIQIIDENVYITKPPSMSIVGRRPAHFISVILDVIKIYKGRVPDTDFVINTADQAARENLNFSPIFTYNKYKTESTVAIPFKIHGMKDIYALSSGKYIRKPYKFKNKKSKAVWRGRSNGEIRKKIYEWTRHHKDIIDYEFSSDPTFYLPMGEQEQTYKYIMDVDGFGWSSRFIQLLNVDMVIVKQESLLTDFCNEMMVAEKHYLTFSNETELVTTIKNLIHLGDEYSQNMIQERKKHAKQYCSKDAQIMYVYTLLTMYADLQKFKVVKDVNAIYVSNDVPFISYLELFLIIFLIVSIVLSAFCCAQNFKPWKNRQKYIKIESEMEDVQSEESDNEEEKSI